MRTTDKNVWTSCIQYVSHFSQCLSISELVLTRMAEHTSSEWVALQCLCRSEPQEWLNIHSASELLSSVCTDQNHWQEWLILYSECNLLLLFDSQCNAFDWLNLQAKALAVFLKAHFKSNIISSITSYLKRSPSRSLAIFTGLLNFSLPVWLFIYFIPNLMTTALLICMENTFWNVSRDGNFVELFKNSFTLYVESGMREKMEAEIDMILRNQSQHLATDKFKAKFCKIVIKHCLCKLHCFFLHLTHLTTFFT